MGYQFKEGGGGGGGRREEENSVTEGRRNGLGGNEGPACSEGNETRQSK